MSTTYPDPRADEWLHGQSRKYRPTEIVVPIVSGVAPVWVHADGGFGAWFARIDVHPALELGDVLDDIADTGLLGAIADCTHHHPTEDEAWACADVMARRIITAVLEVSRAH